MTRRVGPSGPKQADILIVGEAPGAEEERCGMPFVGASGQELTRMLADAGIERDRCRIVNVCPWRPPGNRIDYFFWSKRDATKLEKEELNGRWPKQEIWDGLELLKQEIEQCNPKVIIALGEVALWALTGENGVTKWRGSILESTLSPPRKVIPTYHPEAVLRQWAWRFVAVRDLRRANDESKTAGIPVPDVDYVVAPTDGEVRAFLDETLGRLQGATRPVRIAVDIETRAGFITCIGLALSPKFAFVIPFIAQNTPNWFTELVELEVVQKLKAILTHENAYIVGQNFVYDMQYIVKLWGFMPRCDFDTIIAHHVCFPGLPKALDFLSSLYLPYHRYWKHELHTVDDYQYWTYNAKDCCITWQLIDPLQKTIDSYGLQSIFDKQMALIPPVMSMMLRGVRVDTKQLGEVSTDIEAKMGEVMHYITTALGHDLNPRSNPQMKTLCYTDFALPEQRNRKTGKATCNNEALTKLGQKEPALKPVFDRIIEYRELGVLKNTFLDAKLDDDQRMHSSFSIVGTETYRFASSQSAFHTGTNMQNIPPVIRKLFVPDPGWVILDVDLDRADLQVVVWEADDDELKQALREGVDMHQLNADTLGCTRPQAKMAVHMTNYGGSARTLAMTMGITVKEADVFQKRWFDAHPGIREWHRRTEEQLFTQRSVSNRFGYKRFYFDRIEGLLPQALAWVPQSTVANVTNEGLKKLHAMEPLVELLVQVHDSVVMQVNKDVLKATLPLIQEAMLVEIPYDDPLTIGVGVKMSDKSWGDCKEITWEGENAKV